MPEAGRPIDILLIEDNPHDVRLTMEAFKDAKVSNNLTVAADGEEALKKAKALHPDLILLDLMLPKCGGFEVLRELQAGDTADIPIVIVTGRCSDRSTSEMIKRESNIKELLEKPIKHHVLSSLMSTLLKGRGNK